ncbi:MAG: sensor histidine kinase, partial [Planctomycetota bacterium]
HQRRAVGGVVFCSPRNEAAELGAEQGELQPFLASLGLAVGRANAYAASQRLSEDLAESNRRLQQAQAKLLRSRALSMIAEMAAGAGHELNTPLTVISGRAQMLASAADDEKLRRDLELIRDKAHECSRIVTELMDFAKPAQPQRAPFDLAALLLAARERCISQTELSPDQVAVLISDTARDETGKVIVFGDEQQCAGVFDELLRNAADAVAENRGTITVRVGRQSGDDLAGLPPADRIPGADASEPDWVVVSVRDTGRGMAPDVLERVFDPFFSHRSAGRRRGLGLPRAYRIIEAHGGRIQIESRVGEGATVHVFLPAA